MILCESTRRGFFAAATIAMMAIAPAAAQDISASHLAAARQAVSAIDATEQFDSILLNSATQIKAELIVNNPNLQNEISNMVDDKALALAPRRADLENEVARVYAKLFTEQELTEIAQFYSSEAGKKLIKQGPAATREMVQAADIWSTGIMRDLRSQTLTAMRELTAGTENAEPTGAAAPASGNATQ
ncbi:DUF2059 domain-containing protein [Aurantimonas sp. Leaf443]|uniref:DUF2059 domain-containing protein n=1 Tax=Aurantimonas sp. Leaf443 TaxID=1736378 RepID=UPI0007021E95|nr:DUF2059 domain-containing protein [Aurantimonas sp. Leaf443]KQT86209.1 hypothetical protein ASG48_06480 [Aurantimonas sp. Leaf443]